MIEMDGKSEDILQDNIEALGKLFPEVLSDGKIDFDKLRYVLGDTVDDESDRYNFTWHGKNQARRLSQTPSMGTLRPCKAQSKDWDTTQNLYIEGDNLEVLKLLQKSYHGKVKMIYIDPPYNSGEDFIYHDDFRDNLETYKHLTNQVDDYGYIYTTNSESSGRYHTNWLNMIFPRLRIARNLLADDGVIFISIDDDEEANLKKVCDEVFGEDNFINIISLKFKNVAGASGGGEDKKLKKNMEFVLAYAKNYAALKPFNHIYEYTPIDELLAQYRENETSWKYTSALISPGDKVYIGSTKDGNGDEIKVFRRDNYVIKSVSALMKEEELSEKDVYKKYANCIFQTAMPQSSIRPRVMKKVQEIGIESEVYSIEYTPKSGKNKGKKYEQFYKGENFRLFAWLRDVSEVIDGQLCKKDLQGTFWDYVSETKNLTKEGNVPFPNGKKPIKLIQQMLSMITEKNDLILDFFSGSATTAHAVMKINADDNGSRRFIMVQLPEVCKKGTEAHKAGFKTICQIGEERIRRAGEQIKNDCAIDGDSLDVGFRVFKLDTSNLKKWQPDDSKPIKQLLLDAENNVLPDRSEEDVLYEIILKLGYDLSCSIEEHTIAGTKVFVTAAGALFICLADRITSAVAEGMAKLHRELAPEVWKVVCRDTGFQTDADKVNVREILKSEGLDEDAFVTL